MSVHIAINFMFISQGRSGKRERGNQMPKYRKKIWAGDIYEVEEFYSPRTVGKKYERGRNENLTSEEQEKRNLEIARKNLTRTINANFGKEDYFVLFTYDRIVTEEEAKKEMQNFFSRLKRWRKRNGFGEVKYIQVTETEGRVHHHVILNGFDGFSLKEAREVLQSVWDRGLVKIKSLKKNQRDTKLATYISKENTRKGTKRWTRSRNLKEPKVTIEQVKETKGKKAKPLHVPKGYDLYIKTEDFFPEIGWVRYMKAVKKGGMDYGDCND